MLDAFILLATAWHVSHDATGSGSTPDDPASLAAALAQATSGDSIILAPGEYSFQSAIRLDVAGLTLQGARGVELHPQAGLPCVAIEISAPRVRLEDLHIDASEWPGDGDCEQRAVIQATEGADALRLDGVSLRGANSPAAPGAVELPAGTAATGILLDRVGSTELSNLRLSDIPATAIRITGATERVRIGHADIVNSGHRAIHLIDSEGRVEISSNRISGALNEGIFLQQVTGTVVIEQNVVEDIRYLPAGDEGAGIEGGIVHTNTSGRVDTTIRVNTVDIDPDGMTRALTGEELLDIDGIEVNLFGTASGFALIEGNTIRNTEDDGIDVDTLDSAELNIVIRNNLISGVHDRGLSVVAAGQSIQRILIEGNEVTGPDRVRDHPSLSGDGIGIRPRQDSEVHLVVRNNKVRHAGRRGIDINMNRGSSGHGPVNQAQAFFRFEGNRVDGAAQRGLDVQLEDRAAATGVLLGNMIRGAAGDGIRVHSGAGDEESLPQVSRLQVSVVNNDVSDSAILGDAGVLARAQQLSTLCLHLAGNHSSNPLAGHDYMIRSQHDSWIELAGTTDAVEPGGNALRAILSASGNRGRAEKFSAPLQGNPVRPPERCKFPPDHYLPELPSPSRSDRK